MPSPYTPPQKWHITAYFTYAELPHLPTIDHDQNLRKIIVPSGIYRTGKTRSRSAEDDLPTGSGTKSGDPHANSLPSLATIHSDLGAPFTPPPRPQGVRLPEDQRVIQMLNSRHIK
jgi:hypothetical protein